MNALFPALPPTHTGQPRSDVAYTPEEVIRAILHDPEEADRPSAVLRPGSNRVWEPCAGGGAWVRALREELGDRWMEIHATEIDPGAASIRAGLATHGDALNPMSCPWANGSENYEIWTNPPFSLANDLLRAWLAFPNPPRRVILLLLQAWPNPEERAWVWPHMRQEIVLYPRISFGGPGRKIGQTDQRDYAIFEFAPSFRLACYGIHKKRFDWRARVLS